MIELRHGAGGISMHKLISSIRKKLRLSGKWKGLEDDSAFLKVGSKWIGFTTDSYVISPIKFKGGDIGKLAVCGTLNDLAVMGVQPLALSLSFILEEGLPKNKLQPIVKSIDHESEKAKVPIATGDTKVMESDSIDKLVINTAGIGFADKILNHELKPGDRLIASGQLGDHEASLLALRFGYETKLQSDCSSILKPMQEVKNKIKFARDPTRGGLAAVAQEMASRFNRKVLIDEEKIPYKQEVITISEILGLEKLNLASEGKFICVASPENSSEVVRTLKKFDSNASEIGKINEGSGVLLKTEIGATKRLHWQDPDPNPRIC